MQVYILVAKTRSVDVWTANLAHAKFCLCNSVATKFAFFYLSYGGMPLGMDPVLSENATFTPMLEHHSYSSVDMYEQFEKRLRF